MSNELAIEALERNLEYLQERIEATRKEMEELKQEEIFTAEGRAKQDQRYYYINTYMMVNPILDSYNPGNDWHYDLGNYYLDESVANVAAEHIRKYFKIIKVFAENGVILNPDTYNSDEVYYIYKHPEDERWYSTCDADMTIPGVPYLTEGSATLLCNLLNSGELEL